MIITLLRKGNIATQEVIPVSEFKNILISGDSTMASYYRDYTIADKFFSEIEKTYGYTAFSIAANSSTIANQLSAWNLFQNKSELDLVVVQIGLNDCELSGDIIANYQNYINQIISSKAQKTKILISCMLPCRLRWGINQTAIQNFNLLNSAIMDGTITGVDFRNNKHVSKLGDLNGNLLPFYDIKYDHIHENEYGAQIIRNSIRETIGMPIISIDPISSYFDLNFASQQFNIYQKHRIFCSVYGTNGYGNTAINSSKILHEGIAGRIYYKALRGDKQSILGFSTENNAVAYEAMKYCILFDSSLYAKELSAGFVNTGFTQTEGSFYGINRSVDGFVSVQSSNDEINWTTIYTYNNQYSGDLYPVIDLLSGVGSSSRLSQPKCNY